MRLNYAVADAIVCVARADHALATFECNLQLARTSLEAHRIDEARDLLGAAAHTRDRLQQFGYLTPPALMERLEVLQFAARRGFL